MTTFMTASHLSLTWARSFQSTPFHPNSLRSILILSSHLHPGLTRISPYTQPKGVSYYSHETQKRKVIFYITGLQNAIRSHIRKLCIYYKNLTII